MGIRNMSSGPPITGRVWLITPHGDSEQVLAVAAYLEHQAHNPSWGFGTLVWMTHESVYQPP